MRVGEAAAYLGVSRQKVQRLIQSGQLPAEIIPGDPRRDRWVRREDLERVFQPVEKFSVMRCLRVLVGAALLLSLLAGPAWAGSRADACELGTDPGSRLAGTAGCLLLGAGLGLATHEAGHAVVGGSDVAWQGTNFRCRGCSAGRAQVVGMAGFAAEALSTEALLLSPNTPREHPVLAGWLLWNVLHPIAYAIRSEVRGGTGDFANFQDPRQRRLAEGLIVGVALLQAYRLVLRDARFPLFFAATAEEIRVAVQARW